MARLLRRLPCQILKVQRDERSAILSSHWTNLAAASESEPLKPPSAACCSYTQSMKPSRCVGFRRTCSAESEASAVETVEEGRRAREARQKYARVILVREGASSVVVAVRSTARGLACSRPLPGTVSEGTWRAEVQRGHAA